MGEYLQRKQSQDALITTITRLKLRLIGKYGPQIKTKWEK